MNAIDWFVGFYTLQAFNHKFDRKILWQKKEGSV